MRNSALLIVSVLCASPPKTDVFATVFAPSIAYGSPGPPFLSQQLHYADAWYINRSTYLDPRHSRTYPRYPPSCGGWLVLNLKNYSQRTKYRRWLASPLASYCSVFFPFAHPLYIEHKFLVVKKKPFARSRRS